MPLYLETVEFDAIEKDYENFDYKGIPLSETLKKIKSSEKINTSEVFLDSFLGISPNTKERVINTIGSFISSKPINQKQNIDVSALLASIKETKELLKELESDSRFLMHNTVDMKINLEDFANESEWGARLALNSASIILKILTLLTEFKYLTKKNTNKIITKKLVQIAISHRIQKELWSAKESLDVLDKANKEKPSTVSSIPKSIEDISVSFRNIGNNLKNELRAREWFSRNGLNLPESMKE